MPIWVILAHEPEGRGEAGKSVQVRMKGKIKGTFQRPYKQIHHYGLPCSKVEKEWGLDVMDETTESINTFENIRLNQSIQLRRNA